LVATSFTFTITEMNSYLPGGRNLQQTKENKTSILRQAVLEMRYVLKHSEPNFKPRPEIHNQIGLALLLMGDTTGAQVEFKKAALFKKSLTPLNPYDPTNFFGDDPLFLERNL